MGNGTRKGPGETRPTTEREAEDRSGPRASNVDAGSGAAGKREDGHSPPPGREPLPTRVNGLPPLPAEYRVALDQGLEAIGVTLDPAASETISTHVRLLVAWNAAINLTAVRDPVAMATAHVVDSLAALPILRFAGVDEFVDLGSGGGFPGLPLAVALPARRALLVDSVGKKARFLGVAVETMDLGGRVAVSSERAEALAARSGDRGGWRCVVARAIAGLGELAELSLPLLRVGGLLVAWKSEPVDGEIDAADEALYQLGGRVDGVRTVHASGLEGHVLVAIQKVRETPARFPRDPAARRRQPL